MGQIKFVGAMVLTALFAIAIVSFLVGFAADNDAIIDINDESEVSSLRSNVQSNIVTFKNEANSTSKALFESEINPDEETTRTGGQFKGSVSGAFGAVKNILSLGNKYIFEDEEGNSGFGIITTALISFLTFALGLYIWKAWKGNPD